MSQCTASGFVHSDDMQMIWCDSDEGEFERISREECVCMSEWVVEREEMSGAWR